MAYLACGLAQCWYILGDVGWSRCFMPLLPSWWTEYQCPFLPFVSTSPVFTYFSRLYQYGGPDDIQRVITLANLELAVLEAVQLLLYAAEGPSPDYKVGSLHFDHVRGAMLARLPSFFAGVLSHFAFIKTSDWIRTCPVLEDLTFYRMAEVHWSLRGGADEFVAYNFARRALRGSPAERLALVEDKKLKWSHGAGTGWWCWCSLAAKYGP